MGFLETSQILFMESTMGVLTQTAAPLVFSLGTSRWSLQRRWIWGTRGRNKSLIEVRIGIL